MASIAKAGGGAAPTATSVVAEALARIVLTEMSPGTSLPSEGDLATRFEVSRLTVREAVKMLAGRGLLDVGRGRRAADFPAALLTRRERASEVPVAPAHGLTLVAVDYPPDDDLAARADSTRRVRTPSGS